MKAVILAGGKGTRLYPLTKDLPKPMVPIGGRPLLEWQILLLRKYGIKEIILCTNYLHEVIENHFKDGKEYAINIQYSREQEECGTAGAIKCAEQLIGKEDFFVLFGDEMININLLQMMRYHKKHGHEATVLVHETTHPYDNNIIGLNKENQVIRIFRVKQGDNFQPINLSCVYVLKQKILPRIPLKFCDFGKQIFPQLIEEGVKIQAYLSEEYAKDIGTPERLANVEQDLREGYIFGLPNAQGEYL